ncbi:hypothetical protein CLF_110450 [Clonorchis sinensis]|uniref:Uncharacterized protein n=1 Tax=Clonorchis sinensis TaxID=79923 RepID=G7YTI7_CLOSI|nr:hypothetical protein CLF_110450 [Clonorchis sinensis]
MTIKSELLNSIILDCAFVHIMVPHMYAYYVLHDGSTDVSTCSAIGIKCDWVQLLVVRVAPKELKYRGLPQATGLPKHDDAPSLRGVEFQKRRDLFRCHDARLQPSGKCQKANLRRKKAGTISADQLGDHVRTNTIIVVNSMVVIGNWNKTHLGSMWLRLAGEKQSTPVTHRVRESTRISKPKRTKIIQSEQGMGTNGKYTIRKTDERRRNLTTTQGNLERTNKQREYRKRQTVSKPSKKQSQDDSSAYPLWSFCEYIRAFGPTVFTALMYGPQREFVAEYRCSDDVDEAKRTRGSLSSKGDFSVYQVLREVDENSQKRSEVEHLEVYSK